jgi:hypothetical protein
MAQEDGDFSAEPEATRGFRTEPLESRTWRNEQLAAVHLEPGRSSRAGEKPIPVRVARRVLMLCYVLDDHRATCYHYG